MRHTWGQSRLSPNGPSWTHVRIEPLRPFVWRRRADTNRIPPSRSSAEPFLPHALVATFAVIVVPALAVSSLQTSGRPWLLLASMLLAMALSVTVSSVGAALWARRPNSRDIVFADLMLWGWLRRVRAERRLAEAQGLLGSGTNALDGAELSHERRCKVLQRLAAMLETKDADTLGHSRRVTRHAERIARDMGLSREEVARVRIAASIHDVGKVHTPRHILTKPESLTAVELAIMKRHPVDGSNMAAEMGDPEMTAMVRHHHERMDGTGYPDGLRREQIPLGSRIIAVADTFDAITSSRAYHGARNHRRALQVVSEEAGWRLDPEAVAAFLRYYSGKRSVAWSALGFAGTPRLASFAGGPLSGIGASAPPVLQSFAAVVAAAIAGVALGGEPQASAASDRASAAASQVAQPRTGARNDSGSREAGRADGGPGARVAPVDDRPADGLRGNGPQDGPPGGPASPGSPNPGSPNPGDGTSPPPAAETPAVDLPDVELPAVGLPGVRLPDIAVPDVQVPLSQLVPGAEDLHVELPQIRLGRGG
jgi:putative nucleotidyltransferase with HDIG domain